MLARAKTGTGKTLAFLIPSIEMLARAQKAPEPACASPALSCPLHL